MMIVFYLAGAVAIISTVMMLTRTNAVHALLYLIVSLLAVAVVFYTLGAPFVAALEVIIYAGAIMVLFVFVVMLLNLGEQVTQTERAWLHSSGWLGPAVLGGVLAAELIYVLVRGIRVDYPQAVVDPRQVGASLFGTYLVGVELASFLLLAGLVAAYHLGWRKAERSENR